MIFVSPEIGSADLGPLLEKRGLKVSVAKLDTADVEFAGRGVKGEPLMIGVEVKRLTELTSDWDRFAGHQLQKMLPAYAHRWLLYEGEWNATKKGVLIQRKGRRSFRALHGQSNASQLTKKLITLEMCGGFHRHHTKTRTETVAFLVDLYRWWNDDDFDEHKSHIVNYQPHGIIPLTKFEQAFAAWPGLSSKRAKAVARAFHNSIRLSTGASVEEWANIEVPDDEGKMRRIGPKLAQALLHFVNGEEPK